MKKVSSGGTRQMYNYSSVLANHALRRRLFPVQAVAATHPPSLPSQPEGRPWHPAAARIARRTRIARPRALC
jgi:hypothetical protein